MDIAIIRHTATDELDVYHHWAAHAHHQLHIIESPKDRPPQFLPLSDFDGVIILGGPQRAANIERYPNLLLELEFIEQVKSAGKPMLGVCLGAQLLGNSYGARAALSPEPELGYLPIQLTPEGQSDPIFSVFNELFYSMQWHHDMIGVPQDAVILAYSAGCPVQAIQFEHNIYGVQFHLDFAPATIDRYLVNSKNKMPTGPFVQAAQQMQLADFNKMRVLMSSFLDKLFQ